MVATYEIVKGGEAIKCLVCNMTSYHPVDVRERFCGNCHEFHDQRALRRRMVKIGAMKEI